MVFKRTIAAMLLLITGCSVEAAPDIVGYVADTKDGVVLAYTTPCKITLPGEAATKQAAFKAAKFINKDRTVVNGCWAPFDETTIVLWWEDGKPGWMYQHNFRLLRET